MSTGTPSLTSVCVYCGSSDAVDPAMLEAADRLGRDIAGEGLRLVYGGAGVGLMGACARGAHAAGGQVLGIIPDFLIMREGALLGVETQVVESMHERKIRMFNAADAFAVLPGAIGTLEETIELISWRRLGLHTKPIVFYNPDGFWDPLFALFESFISRQFIPSEFTECYAVVHHIDDVLPTLQSMPTNVLVGYRMARP
jgi:uncharacterized protein (TIGR00730 family)